MSRRKYSKKRAMNIHARMRALTRRQVFISPSKVVGMIQSGNARIVEKISNTRSIFALNYDGKEIMVIYNKKEKSISTTLPQKGKDI